MKRFTATALAAVSVFAAAPALAQASNASAANASAPARLSAESSTIGAIAANPAAKAALEKVFPEIMNYFGQIKGMTLKDLAPMSQGVISDGKLKALQAELDQIRS